MIKSTFTANKVLDDNLAGVFLTVYTAPPNIGGGGTEGQVTRQSVVFDTAVAGATQNNNIVTYANIPTDTYTSWGIFDALTGGNLIYFGDFSVPIIFSESGGELTFEVGDVKIREA